MSSFSIILTAGGIGKRMGESLPKQFMEIAGKPILVHTLELFHAYDPSAQFIVTLPADWKAFWNELLDKHGCLIPHEIVNGGNERYYSIKNALSICTGDFIVVHDGVRPFVSKETLKRCFEAVEIYGQVIPTIPVKESLRQLFDDASRAINRSDYCLVQTPQCFHASVLRKAYEIPFHAGITDDASLVEEAGFPIHLVEGNEENTKITTPYDFKIAEYLMK